MQFVDHAPISGTRKTSDGYLVAEVRVARIGIQDYAGYEVGKPDMRVVKVYRPEDQVFSADSLRTYAHRPVTNDHPSVAVTSDNWRELSVGSLGEEVARDGDYVKVPLIVMDNSAIRDIEADKRELSAGYTCDLSFEEGETPDGQKYDAVQRNIRINHVAIVKNGRAGSQARIGDGAWGIKPLPSTDPNSKKEKIMTLKTITVDGIPVEVTDQGATVIATLQKRLADAEAKSSAAEKASNEAIAAKDSELAKRDAEIDALKEKVLDDSALDAKVLARGDLISKAKSIVADVKTDGLSDADIRKAVVVAKHGDAMKDKPESYIDARFDILVEAVADGIETRSILSNISSADAGQKVNDAQSAYVSRLTRKSAA